MKASHIMNILQLMAEEAEQAPGMEEHGESVAGALFLGEQFARNAHLLSFFGEHRLMGAGACDINPKWDRLKQALVSYCRSLPKGMAAPMLKFLKSDSSRLLNERPKRGKDQHVVGQVPVVRGVAVNGFKEACENVVQHIAFTGKETGNALSLYRGTTILPEAVSWQDLREVAFAMSEEAAKPKGDMGAPFFFNQTIVSGIYRLCHGKIEDADTEKMETFVELHDDIQTGLMKLVSGVAEVAGLTIRTVKSRRGTHAGRETTVVEVGSKSFRIPGPMKFPAGSVEDFPFDDFRKDLELLNALALKAVKHIKSLPDDAVNWDNQCDKYSIEIARKALYEYGFDDYADGNVPMGLTVEQFFRVVETMEPDVAEVHGKVKAGKTNQTPDDEGRFNERPWGLEDGHQYGAVLVVHAGSELKWKTGKAKDEYGLPEEMPFRFQTGSMWRVFARVIRSGNVECHPGNEMGRAAQRRSGSDNGNEGWLFRELAFVKRNAGRPWGWAYRLRRQEDDAAKPTDELTNEIAAYKRRHKLP